MRHIEKGGWGLGVWLWGLGGGHYQRGCRVSPPPTPLIPSLRARCLQGFPLTTPTRPLVPVPRPRSLASPSFLHQNTSPRNRTVTPSTHKPFPRQELRARSPTCCWYCRICLRFHCPPKNTQEPENERLNFCILKEVLLRQMSAREEGGVHAARLHVIYEKVNNNGGY